MVPASFTAQPPLAPRVGTRRYSRATTSPIDMSRAGTVRLTEASSHDKDLFAGYDPAARSAFDLGGETKASAGPRAGKLSASVRRPIDDEDVSLGNPLVRVGKGAAKASAGAGWTWRVARRLAAFE
jgi:hypothetical protein